MEANNWRTHLAQTIRHKVINRIISVIVKGVSVSLSRQPNIHEVEKLAFSFEEKIFKEATSKEDYLRKIHLRVQSIQIKCQQKIANSLQSDPSYTCENLSDHASIQPQMQQGQDKSYPLASQTVSAGVRSSTNSTMTMTPAMGSSQIPKLNFADQNPNSQIASGISQNSRQVQGRHHLLQSHQSQQYPCKHQLQHEVLKPQSLLSHTPPQSSRESVMQASSAMQPYVFQTDSQSSTQWPTQSVIHQRRAPTLLQPKMPSQQQQDTLQGQNMLDSMLQGQNAIEHPKQCGQLQSGFPAMSSMALDSAPKTRDESKGDWVEELFQRLKTMKEKYLPDLKEMSKKVPVLFEPGDFLPPRFKTGDQSGLKRLDFAIRQTIYCLNLRKCELTLDHKGKIGQLEERIMNLLDLNRRLGSISSLGQRQLSALDLQSLQPQPQKLRFPIHGNQISPDLQIQHQSIIKMEQNSLIASEDDCQFSSEVTSSQKSMINSPPPVTNLDKEQGSAPSSSLHSPASTFQCATLLSQSGGNVPHQSINPLNSNSSVLQNIHLKQQKEHQMVKAQQGKQQFQQHQVMQQSMQQRELLAQQHSQQPTNLQARKKPSLHQMNEINRVKMGHGMGIKAGILLQHHSIEQRLVNKLQAMKSEPPSPVSSYQSQHSSPLMGQENLRTSLTKDGNFLQSRNPHPTIPSPSSPSIISPIKGDHEKLGSGNSSLSNTGSIGHQQTTGAVTQDTPFIISTPGLSISPLLAESIDLDNNSTMVFCEASLNEKPLQRLISVVRSMSHKALSASVSDIESVVRMVERTAGSLPGNGCRSATGKDLAAMTNCNSQGRNAINLYEIAGTKNMRRYVSAIPSNLASSAGSINISLKRPRDSDTSDLESTGTSRTNRPKIEAIYSLLKEIWEINHQLIRTVIDVSYEGLNPTAVSSVVTEAGEGTIVICSFSTVTFSPNSNLQHSSAQMPPTLSLRLLVPINYPTFSPILIDESPTEFSTEYEDLLVKAKSKLRVSLRCLMLPISLGDIAKTWDVCAYSVISEYAHQNGGGNFSSRYGTWENCLTVT